MRGSPGCRRCLEPPLTSALSPLTLQSAARCRIGYARVSGEREQEIKPGEMPCCSSCPILTRLGTETAFEVLARAEALGRQGKYIVNLGIGQPDFKTPAAYRRGRHQGAARRPSRLHAGTRHPAAARGGGEDLKRRHGVEVHPDTIVIWPGGKPTMFFSILMFGQPGAEIMYPDPGFPIYRSMIEYTGAKPVPIVQNEANQFSFTADQVLGADHAQDEPDHPQQPRQSLRRRRQQGGDRQAGGGPREAPQRRDHVG